MTEEEWKAFEELAVVSDEVIHPKRLGVATYTFGTRNQFLAILAAYRELKERREDEEWLREKVVSDEIASIDFYYSPKSGVIFSVNMMDFDKTSHEGPTIHAAILASRGGESCRRDLHLAHDAWFCLHACQIRSRGG
jgi:hypothetical protein